jgi:hypothetical protein
MSRTEDARDKQRQNEREASDFSEETGYRPSVNQRRHEPLPASRHDERRQEAVLRNEEHTGAQPPQAEPPQAEPPQAEPPQAEPPRRGRPRRG